MRQLSILSSIVPARVLHWANIPRELLPLAIYIVVLMFSHTQYKEMIRCTDSHQCMRRVRLASPALVSPSIPVASHTHSPCAAPGCPDGFVPHETDPTSCRTHQCRCYGPLETLPTLLTGYVLAPPIESLNSDHFWTSP